MRAVILAGGKGTRLIPISSVLPKPLVPLGNKPILEILIRQLKNQGFDQITLAVGHLSHLIKAVFGDGSNLGVSIDYSDQKKILGTAGPITLVENLDEDFLVLNGDLLTNISFKKMFKYHTAAKADVTVGVYQRLEKIDLGIVEVKSGQVKKYIEKPTHTYDVSSGIYVVSPKALTKLKYNQYCDFPDFIRSLIRSKRKVSAYKFDQYWLDLGRPDDYYKAYELFEKNPYIFLPKKKKAKRK